MTDLQICLSKIRLAISYFYPNKKTAVMFFPAVFCFYQRCFNI